MCTVYGYSNSQCDVASPLQELACYMKSRSVTCHPAEVTFPPLLPAEAVTRFSAPDECKAEFAYTLSKGAVPKRETSNQTNSHNYVKNQPIFLIISLICSKVVDNGLDSICRTRRYTTLWNINVRKQRQPQTNVIIRAWQQSKVAPWKPMPARS